MFYVHTRGHFFQPKFIKLCQNVNPNKIYDKLTTGSCYVKTRSLSQIFERPGVHSCGQSFDPSAWIFVRIFISSPEPKAPGELIV